MPSAAARSRSLFAPAPTGLAWASGATRALKKADPVLAALMKKVGPFRLEPVRSFQPFEALATSISHQQLTGKAAETILGRVKDLYAPKRFPTPQDLVDASEASLRGAGLSGSKVAAMKDLARHTLEGAVPTARALKKLSDEEIINRLTVVRGIGQWTVEMMLIFRLGRPDILPVNDYGVRKGYSRTFGLEALVLPKELERQGERWRPFRTMASWYFWRALELPE